MIGTGMNIIDELLDGGVPKGKSLLYYIQPGVEGEFYGLQMIFNSLRCAGTCVFVASSTSPSVIKSQFKDFGWNIDPYKNRFFFVDAYNPLIRAPSKEKYIISNPDNIYEFSKSIINILKELQPSTILFGSLSTIMDLCGEAETIEAVKTWNRIGKLHGHIIVYNFTAWPYSKRTLDFIRNDLFNAVISIGGISDHVIFGKYLGILKSDLTC
ncbi:MAG: hypothetical protein O8C66_12645 [Candidatus Methanoperedens sp.]|nr:hypothetical protein [Candidatus Methanoperedens sp.]MCZ7371348.1 hypothetical protein [Candidatus Methanoperedens sp.]